MELCRLRVAQLTKLVQWEHCKIILESSISQFDRTLLYRLCSESRAHTGIMVFYTGPGLPDFCSAMVREPLPK